MTTHSACTASEGCQSEPAQQPDILAENPLTKPPTERGKLPVDVTLVDGRVECERSGAFA